MSVHSPIQWTEATWNPTTGCDRISAGCDHCYALTLAKRLKGMGSPKYQTDGDPRTSGPGFGVAVHPSALYEPLRWRKPRTVFVNSMSDLFHARVPTEYIARVWAVMGIAHQHTFQVLTKRDTRLQRLLGSPNFRLLCENAEAEIMSDPTAPIPQYQRDTYLRRWWSSFSQPLANVWIGVSVENTAQASRRVRALQATAAATRFLSLEPLLGPLPGLDLADINWVIAGGESGPNHRPLDLNWVRDIRDRCQAAHVAFFFKQVGGITPKSGGRLLDGRTWDQYPPRRPVTTS